MSWGSPGRGRWVTIYASPGHVYMVVNGRRFDTTGRYENGTRWQPAAAPPPGTPCGTRRACSGIISAA